jgi:hypothetical protein
MSQQITISRVFDAPPELVYRAFTGAPTPTGSSPHCSASPASPSSASRRSHSIHATSCPIISYAGHRPLAWIDDALPPEAHAWAANRRIPTLLIDIDPAEGLTRSVIEQSLQWADDHRRNAKPQT